MPAVRGSPEVRSRRSGPEWPTLEYETLLWAAGYRRLAGLDEVGRGAWAGPVVAAAVMLPPEDPGLWVSLHGVCDSKQLTARQRTTALENVVGCALAWGIGSVPADQIDSKGIVACTRQAMTLALETLSTAPDALLIDYLSLPAVGLHQVSLPKGDARVMSIASASVVAKVFRDRLMADFDAQFPGYGFARNKGYGTAQHRAALDSQGPCAIHRLSFGPLHPWRESYRDVRDGVAGR
jgi:ribonuclease HII